MKKMIAISSIALAAITQAETKIDSFCGIKLDAPISEVMKGRILHGAIPQTRTYTTDINTPFRGFKEAKISVLPNGRTYKVALWRSLEVFESTTNDIGQIEFQQKNKPTYYSRDEAIDEFETIVKLLKARFGEPTTEHPNKDTKDYIAHLAKDNPSYPRGGYPRDRKDATLCYGDVRIDVSLNFIRVRRGMVPPGLRRSLPDPSQRRSLPENDKTILYNCKLTITCENNVITKSYDGIKEKETVKLKGRCKEFSQDEVDSL